MYQLQSELEDELVHLWVIRLNQTSDISGNSGEPSVYLYPRIFMDGILDVELDQHLIDLCVTGASDNQPQQENNGIRQGANSLGLHNHPVSGTGLGAWKASA